MWVDACTKGLGAAGGGGAAEKGSTSAAALADGRAPAPAAAAVAAAAAAAAVAVAAAAAVMCSRDVVSIGRPVVVGAAVAARLALALDWRLIALAHAAATEVGSAIPGQALP